jgi:acyl dehydratase
MEARLPQKASLGMVGSSTGAQLVRWDERDVMLYAIGIGAGLAAPARELGFTTENSGGVTLRVIPSFLTILAARQRPPALQMLDAGQFLHGEQSVELSRPLPPSGQGFLCCEIDEVLDKGNGAIVSITATLRDDGAALIGRSRMRIFVRGAGGFGGPRGEVEIFQLPGRAEDVRIVQQTRPEQALLYRLSGDRNPLHSDPAFATTRGFEGPILHGLCTYGFACRALIETVCEGDPARLRAMGGRFRTPVYPGDTLTTEIWNEAGGVVLFQTIDGRGNVAIERGRAVIAG